MNEDIVCDLGGASLQLCPNTKFFAVDLPKSVYEWHKYWFYVSRLGDNLHAYVNEPPKKLRSWAPLNCLSPNDWAVADATAHLKASELKGGHILKTWVERCILPLQARPAPMYEYTGLEDLTRVSKDELGLEEIGHRLSILTSLVVIKDAKVTTTEPFSAAYPRSNVSVEMCDFFSWYLKLVLFFSPFLGVPEFAAFEAFCSETPLPGKVVDATVFKLMEPSSPKPEKASGAPPKRRKKAAEETSEQEDPDAEAFDGDEAAKIPEEGEDDETMASAQEERESDNEDDNYHKEEEVLQETGDDETAVEETGRSDPETPCSSFHQLRQGPQEDASSDGASIRVRSPSTRELSRNPT